MLVLLLFFFSGATALVYEVIWSKYLGLLFGSTIQAQTVVLAVFMGGLAAGNRLFSGYADRAARPLALYGGMEMAIGTYALAFRLLDRIADGAFVTLGSRLLEHVGGLLVLKAALSIALLAVPTVLMGGTLPVLAAWLQRRTGDAARFSARLYATNSLGAVLGAAIAGFCLVPALGLWSTLAGAAVVNFAIGFVALSAARRPARDPAGAAAAAQPGGADAGGADVLRRGCLVVALSGSVSMALEVLASRCLALVFGSSLQAFTTMLIAFILGIGAGGIVVASPLFRRGSKRVTAPLLIVAAALITVLVLNLVNLVELYRFARSGLSPTPIGYHYYEGMVLAIALVVLGTPAALLGAVVPLWIRIVSPASNELGRRVGTLLTWNTLGGVAGSLVAGFGLMPAVGLRGAFIVLALVALAGAAVTAWVVRQRWALAAAALVSAGTVVAGLRPDDGWRYALSSGVFRLQETDPGATPITMRAQATHLLFYQDAADATVSVETDNTGPSPERVLRINGKADASSHGDLSTQILLGQLPLLMRPDATEVFCFGLGSGITAGTVLGHPIAHLTVAENCAPVREAARYFSDWNGGVLTDPRVRIYTEDARTVLKLGRERYDAIISEPSNPWMVNVGSVFSVEFYRLAAARLKPGGIMTQWFHTYEMDDATVSLVLRTFNAVFPAMEIWDAGGGDIIMLGSDRPWKSAPEVFAPVFARARPRRDLAAIGITNPAAVLARQLASQRTAFAIASAGPLQTDAHPVLEYAAPRAMFVAANRQAQDLQRFDERTYQAQLEPPEKAHALRELGDQGIKTVFYDAYPSVNPGLQQYVRSRIENNGNGDIGLLSMPCVFRPRDQIMVFEPAVARTNVLVGQLCAAEAAVEQHPDACGAAVDAIRDGLNAVQGYHRWNAGWSAAYIAYVGSEAGLRLGRSGDAKAILLRGLQLEPDSEELNYLSRILIHEGVLQPSEYVAALRAGA